MYKIGEKIIYGKTGVCVVESIEEKTVPGGKRPYYTLKPMYQQNNVIYAPADSDKIFMRPLISRENAERLVESVSAIRDSVLAGNTVRMPTAAPARSCCALRSEFMKSAGRRANSNASWAIHMKNGCIMQSRFFSVNLRRYWK